MKKDMEVLLFKNELDYQMKIRKILKEHWLFVVILIVGLILRLYKSVEWFSFAHDQDLASWVVKDIVVNKHLRLIGQETSTQGIFIGGLWYYFLIPFYLLFNMNPLGSFYASVLVGLITLISIYYIFLKVFDKKTALVGALIYSVSYYAVFNDRETVPTVPVFLWTVWFFYAIHLILKNKQKLAFIIIGILIGLIWHINFALILLLPLIIAAIALNKKKLKIKPLVYGGLVAFVTNIPFMLFEARHGFSQLNAAYVSLTTDQNAVLTATERFFRTLLLFSRNINRLVWGDIDISVYLLPFFLLSAGFWLVYKGCLQKFMVILFSLWILIFIVFFSLYSKPLSEYYLNGTIMVVIILLSLTISKLLSIKSTRYVAISILVFFTLINIKRNIFFHPSGNGYLPKIQLIKQITPDAAKAKYPCVAISYITDPGYEFGYRYIFWLEDLKIKEISSNIPTYSIVYPLSRVDSVDETFDALGLIFPENEYDKEKVISACEGENVNLTNPMWGVTE